MEVDEDRGELKDFSILTPLEQWSADIETYLCAWLGAGARSARLKAGGTWGDIVSPQLQMRRGSSVPHLTAFALRYRRSRAFQLVLVDFEEGEGPSPTKGSCPVHDRTVALHRAWLLRRAFGVSIFGMLSPCDFLQSVPDASDEASLMSCLASALTSARLFQIPLLVPVGHPGKGAFRGMCFSAPTPVGKVKSLASVCDGGAHIALETDRLVADSTGHLPPELLGVEGLAMHMLARMKPRAAQEALVMMKKAVVAKVFLAHTVRYTRGGGESSSLGWWAGGTAWGRLFPVSDEGRPAVPDPIASIDVGAAWSQTGDEGDGQVPNSAAWSLRVRVRAARLSASGNSYGTWDRRRWSHAVPFSAAIHSLVVGARREERREADGEGEDDDDDEGDRETGWGSEDDAWHRKLLRSLLSSPGSRRAAELAPKMSNFGHDLEWEGCAPPNGLAARFGLACLVLGGNPDAAHALWDALVLHLGETWAEAGLHATGDEDHGKTGQALSVDLDAPMLHQTIQALRICAYELRGSEPGTDVIQRTSGGREVAPREDARGALRPSTAAVDGSVLCRVGTSEVIWEPLTRRPPPVTQALAEANLASLVAIADSRERNRAQSAAVFSDMQAFKAANPGCSLADFAQWTTRGQVSTFSSHLDASGENKDSTEHDIWTELWGEASPIPARDQAPLFDASKVAESLLSNLANTKRSARLHEAAVLASSRLAGELSEVDSKRENPAVIARVLGAARWRGGLTSLDELVPACVEAEVACMTAASLHHKIGKGDSVSELAAEVAQKMIFQGDTRGQGDEGDPIGTSDRSGDEVTTVCTGWVSIDDDVAKGLVGAKVRQVDAAAVRLCVLSPRPAEDSKGAGTRLYARVDAHSSDEGASLRLALAQRWPSEPMQ